MSCMYNSGTKEGYVREESKRIILKRRRSPAAEKRIEYKMFTVITRYEK